LSSVISFDDRGTCSREQMQWMPPTALGQQAQEEAELALHLSNVSELVKRDTDD
jgi:hypothetical protein